MVHYDWKKENPKGRYIDSITEDEAKKIAWLAFGEPTYFEFIKLEINCNGNNIPHVVVHISYYENSIHEQLKGCVGIFYDLNTYVDKYLSTYCQKEIFEYYKEIGFE